MQLNRTMCLDFEFVIDRKLKLIISTICMGNWKNICFDKSLIPFTCVGLFGTHEREDGRMN